jgi:hypothetical protein
MRIVSRNPYRNSTIRRSCLLQGPGVKIQTLSVTSIDEIFSALLQQSWMTDEDVFIALSVVVETINVGYYEDSLNGIHSDLNIPNATMVSQKACSGLPFIHFKYHYIGRPKCIGLRIRIGSKPRAIKKRKITSPQWPVSLAEMCTFPRP